MAAFAEVQSALQREPATWLITGVAGFIGSNLLETLLRLEQNVRGLDNLSTGHRRNLDEVQTSVSAAQWRRFQFVEGDIRSEKICREACVGVDHLLHHAALASVPFSLEHPIETDAVNVTGTLHLLLAARDAKVKRFIYASSSAVYGDCPESVMVEDRLGRPLSPYAATKSINERYADVFGRCYGLATVGLRYFNVFGPRQDPDGAYAAVIPRWIAAFLKGQPALVFGDGETTRDFCHVANVVQANLLAATTANPEALNQVYNVALGEQTTLNQLFALLRDLLARQDRSLAGRSPEFREFRPGDVRHSKADITRARTLLGYDPSVSVADGLAAAIDWYRQALK